MTALLPQGWHDIREHYRSVSERESWADVMLGLVDHIAQSRVGASLYPWTAMFDLLITQTPSAPEEGGYPMPHLRISPKHNQKIEFRYVDTFVKGRQWVRVVDSHQAVDRFDKFVEQLGWLTKRK